LTEVRLSKSEGTPVELQYHFLTTGKNYFQAWCAAWALREEGEKAAGKELHYTMVTCQNLNELETNFWLSWLRRSYHSLQ
jgi:hypothetical protein